MRPNRQVFDSTVAPFIDIGNDVTWYALNSGGDATTLAGQKVMTLKGQGKNGNAIDKVATVGDVMILQDNMVAEAIGIVAEEGKPGELFNLIACNIEDAAAGRCM